MSRFEEEFEEVREYDLLGLTDNECDIIKNIVKNNTLDKQRVREAINRATHPNQLNKEVVIKAELLKELGLEDE